MKAHILTVTVLVAVFVLVAVLPPTVKAESANVGSLTTYATGLAYPRTSSTSPYVAGKPVTVKHVTVTLHNRARGIYRITSGVYRGWYMRAVCVERPTYTRPTTPTTPTTSGGYSIPINAWYYWRIMIDGNTSP
jgi:hypothetical protein